MKCVKKKDSGVVTRISNESAKELVKSGEYTYSTKSTFKRIMRSPIGRAIKTVSKTKNNEIKKLINSVNDAVKANENSSK